MKPLALALCCLVLACAACARKPGAGAGTDGSAAPTPAANDGARTTTGTPGAADEFVTDPYCGMKLKRGEAAASAEVRGTTYYFCLVDHRDAFLADPQRALCRLAGADAGPECDAR
jgi:YHS domain-containing protein